MVAPGEGFGVMSRVAFLRRATAGVVVSMYSNAWIRAAVIAEFEGGESTVIWVDPTVGTIRPTYGIYGLASHVRVLFPDAVSARLTIYHGNDRTSLQIPLNRFRTI